MSDFDDPRRRPESSERDADFGQAVPSGPLGNHVFTAFVVDPGPLAAASLAGFLRDFDGTYRELRWLASKHEAAFLPLEYFVQYGSLLSKEELDLAQEAFREIWETLSEDHAKPISDTLPPMYKYGKAVHDMMNEDAYGLTISWIEMRSPLKIGFLNVVVSAVVLAAILSGGTINCGSMSVVLPPIGQGIAALRDAFGPPGGEKRPAPQIANHLSN